MRPVLAGLALSALWLTPLVLPPAQGAQDSPGDYTGESASAPSTQPAWDERADLVLDPQAALNALEALPADSPAPESWGQGGSRKGWFGEAWMDVDGDGCDTRNEILARDLSQADYSRAPGMQGRDQAAGQGAKVCPDATVWAGTLRDPYTGATINFERGQQTSAAVQIDHVVPLNYLYAHGAWGWDERTRLLAANDPLNLLAVDGKANEAKSACGPATCPVGSTETNSWQTAAGSGWWPPNSEFRCHYAQRFVSVADAYQLGLPEADKDALRATLSDCLAGGDGDTWGLDDAEQKAREVGKQVFSSSFYLWMLALGAFLAGWGLIVRARRRSRGSFLHSTRRSSRLSSRRRSRRSGR